MNEEQIERLRALLDETGITVVLEQLSILHGGSAHDGVNEEADIDVIEREANLIHETADRIDNGDL